MLYPMIAYLDKFKVQKRATVFYVTVIFSSKMLALNSLSTYPQPLSHHQGGGFREEAHGLRKKQSPLTAELFSQENRRLRPAGGAFFLVRPQAVSAFYPTPGHSFHHCPHLPIQ